MGLRSVNTIDFAARLGAFANPQYREQKFGDAIRFFQVRIARRYDRLNAQRLVLV